MSDSLDPHPSSQEPSHGPRYLPPAPPTRSSGRGLLIVLLAISIAFNLLFFIILLTMGSLTGGGSGVLPERFHSGTLTAPDKVAIIEVDGALMEGTMGFVNKQIEAAAADEHVKAIVLRIVSPGGSITASDDLHRRITELREGTHVRQRGGKKPVVVSMGAMAASGGYYIAVPAQWLVAETTTITGSIGVYAAFPNIKELGDKYGFKMNLIKAGDVKASGSMFHEMKPEERQLWQGMVDHAYYRFIHVVEEGRPALKGKMREIVIKEEKEERSSDGNPVLGPDGKPRTFEFTRRRADGGIFTAQQALDLKLIDEIGYQDAAIKKAVGLANLSSYRAVSYERPTTLAGLLFGQTPQPANNLDAGKLSQAATPRLWYMLPQAELTGVLSMLGGH